MASNERSSVGQNVEMELDGDILVIRVNVTKRYGESKSGKTTIIATTQGNKKVPGLDEVYIGLNVYEK